MDDKLYWTTKQLSYLILDMIDTIFDITNKNINKLLYQLNNENVGYCWWASVKDAVNRHK